MNLDAETAPNANRRDGAPRTDLRSRVNKSRSLFSMGALAAPANRWGDRHRPGGSPAPVVAATARTMAGAFRSTLGVLLTLAALATGGTLSPSAGAAEGWRLADSVALPPWLKLSGELRLRHEALDGQFRAGRQGSDQTLNFRGILLAQAGNDKVKLVAEFRDARSWLDDAGSPQNNLLVNTLAIGQLHVAAQLPGLAGLGIKQIDGRYGRMNLDIGSRRFIERQTSRSYDGIHLTPRGTSGWWLDAFYVARVRGEPSDQAAMQRNQYDFDRIEPFRRLWAMHLQYPGLLPLDTQFELLMYGMNESDGGGQATKNRRIIDYGARFLRKPARSQFDYDIEGSARLGQSRQTTDPADQRNLKVRAYNLHAEVGYQFDLPWELRLSLEYNLMTGDPNPADGRYQRYDSLWGARVYVFGHARIYGPLTRSNQDTPGVRLRFARGRFRGYVHYQRARLQNARDVWPIAGLIDPTGQSGRALGNMVDSFLRYKLRPDSLSLDIGLSAMNTGKFPDRVPGGPDERRTLYGFMAVVAQF